MTIQRIFRCHRQDFADMRRVSLYGRTSQNTCKCASSACFPYIICFVRSSQNPEEVRTCQQHCLWFIQICFGQSWAPVLQQQLFCMFKWAFLYALCTFHVLWGSRKFGGSENTSSEFPTIVSHFLGPILCSKAAETAVCCLIRDKIRSCAPHGHVFEVLIFLKDMPVRRTWISVSVFFALWGQTSFKKCGKIRLIQRILKHHETMFLTQGELPYLEKHDPIPILALENSATKLYQCKACPDMFLACSTCQSALFCKELPHNLSLSKPVFSCFILLCGQSSF